MSKANGQSQNPAMPIERKQPEQRRAIARPAVYIDVTLASGQKTVYDVETAKELHAELGAVLESLLNPPPPPKQKRKPRKNVKKAAT